MCMVSVVTGYGMNVPQQSWTLPTWKQFQDLVKRVEDLDKKLGESDCVDPAKDAWMQKMSEMYDEARHAAPKTLNNVISLHAKKQSKANG